MTIDTNVGVSNTAGYSYTGGDPTLTNIVGVGNGITSYTQMGGSKKRKSKKRRPLSKRSKIMSKLKRTSMRKYIKKKTNSRYKKKKMKRRSARKNIIESNESGKPVSIKSKQKLTPSMQSFLESIDTSSNSRSVIKFSDFKSTSSKKKKKKKKKTRRKGQTR